MPSLGDLFASLAARNQQMYGGKSWWADYQTAAAGGKDVLAEWMNTRAWHYSDFSQDAAEFASRTLAQEQEHTRNLFGINVEQSTADKIGNVAAIGGKIGVATAVVMGAYAAGAAVLGGGAASAGGAGAASAGGAEAGAFSMEAAEVSAGAGSGLGIGVPAAGAGASSSFVETIKAAGTKLATSAATSLAVRALGPKSTAAQRPASESLRPTVDPLTHAAEPGAFAGSMADGSISTVLLYVALAALVVALAHSMMGR